MSLSRFLSLGLTSCLVRSGFSQKKFFTPTLDCLSMCCFEVLSLSHSRSSKEAVLIRVVPIPTHLSSCFLRRGRRRENGFSVGGGGCLPFGAFRAALPHRLLGPSVSKKDEWCLSRFNHARATCHRPPLSIRVQTGRSRRRCVVR